MVVYVEYVVIDNFVMTYIIGRLTYIFLKTSVSRRRLCAASIVGSAVALVYPLIGGAIFLLLIKIALAVILCVILFYKKTRLWLSSGLFLLTTAAMGGALFMVGFCVTGSVGDALITPMSELPVAVIVLPPFLLFVFIKKIAVRINRRRDVCRFLYDVGITYNDSTLKVKAFMDSGNQLYDDRTGLPVVLIGLKCFAGLLTDAELTAVMAGRTEVLNRGAHYLNCATVAGKGRVLVLKPQKFRLYLEEDKNIFIDVMLGLVTFKFKGDYQAILSPALINGKGD